VGSRGDQRPESGGQGRSAQVALPH
jgi:hypothetical protein